MNFEQIAIDFSTFLKSSVKSVVRASRGMSHGGICEDWLGDYLNKVYYLTYLKMVGKVFRSEDLDCLCYTLWSYDRDR